MERALFTAVGCKDIGRILVSSDDNEIIDHINEYGDYAPFRRPAEFAIDEAGSLEVIQHALDWAEKEDDQCYDSILLLEPPCPFRLPIHLSEALEIAFRTNGTSVMSVIKVGDQHPIRMKKMGYDGSLKGYFTEEPEGLRRQDQDPAYIRNGAVNIFPRATIMSGRLWGSTPYGYLMDRSLYGINIDESIDVLTANAFYREMNRMKGGLSKIEYIPGGIRKLS